MRFFLPLILIGVAVAGFFILIQPLMDEVKVLKADLDSYNEALDNSKALEAERDKLTKQYNSFDPEDLNRLEVLLPNSINNIRLILEVEKVATPYGMVLRDVKYDTVREEDQANSEEVIQAGAAGSLERPKEYGVWGLEFSTTGSYTNFLNFLRNLESNLRLIDIDSIQFSSVGGVGRSGASPASSDTYGYSFRIKTYWLKNVFQEQ